jgi:hypothetical protein
MKVIEEVYMGEQSHIDKLLETLHHSLTMKEMMQRDDRKFQINARLDSLAFFMLEKLSTDFDEARSGLAAELLGAAIHDLWVKDGRPSIFDDEALKAGFSKFLEQE